MPITSRKRVTRSGKGAFSLYLPKKWVDNWSEEQLIERNVDMLELDEHLIITPSKKNNSRSIALKGGTDDEIRQFLLCTYVRGYESADLKSKKFSDEQICAARSFMRLLDENMILDVSENKIAYGRNFKVNLEPPTISQIQGLLFEKIQESLRLADDLIKHFDENPRRTIHLLKMMRTLEEEDVDRLSMQIFRRATRMEIRSNSFADIYFVVLSTDLLEKLADSIFGIARSVLRFYGIDEKRLLFPLDVVVNDIEVENIRMNGAFEDMRTFFLSSLDECGIRLRKVMELTLEKKGGEAYQMMYDLAEFNKSLSENFSIIFSKVFRSGDGMEGDSLLRMMELGRSIIEIGEMIEEIAKEMAMFYFCEQLSR